MGNSSILPRIKFRVGGQDSSSQSLTAHSLNRYGVLKPDKQLNQKIDELLDSFAKCNGR